MPQLLFTTTSLSTVTRVVCLRRSESTEGDIAVYREPSTPWQQQRQPRLSQPARLGCYRLVRSLVCLEAGAWG